MSIHAVHHVNLRVRAEDLHELRNFYCDVVGLTEGWRPPFASTGYWLYAGDLAVVHLVAMSASESMSVDRYGQAVIDHVAFRCSDMQGMIERLRGRGISYAISEVPVLGDRQILFRDPLGTGVELSFGSES